MIQRFAAGIIVGREAAAVQTVDSWEFGNPYY